MYKFFINDKPLVITSKLEIPKRYNHLRQIQLANVNKLMDLVREIEEPSKSGLIIICDDPVYFFQALKAHFTAIQAGGGIVFNNMGQLLIMKRLGKWDLPKGKIDPGETKEEGAVREVEEECGINKLVIRKFFGNSYHTYKLQGHRFLKITHWYIMDTTFAGKLIPQEEESITEVKWVNLAELNLFDLDTYQSIRDILFEISEMGN